MAGKFERYKDKARMKFEQQFDCNRQFRLWIIANDFPVDVKNIVREALKGNFPQKA